jgi:hypothetical protein
MSLANIVIPPEPIKKGGGGLFGALSSFAGGLVSLGGVLAAPFTGGASMAAVPYGAAMIGGGNAVGSIVDPVTAPTGGNPRGGVDVVETAARQRLGQDPRAVVAGLNESMDALKQSDRRLQSALNPFLEEARSKAMQRIGAS